MRSEEAEDSFSSTFKSCQNLSKVSETVKIHRLNSLALFIL